MIPFLISDSLRRTGGQTQYCPHVFMLADLGGHILGKQSLVDLTQKCLNLLVWCSGNQESWSLCSSSVFYKWTMWSIKDTVVNATVVKLVF